MSSVPPNVKSKVDEIMASEDPVLVKVERLQEQLLQCGFDPP